MDPTTYSFTDEFVVDAARDAVGARLADLEHYASWWPQVRAVGKIDDDHAVVVCRSALPYDLDLHLTAVTRAPELLEVRLAGPMTGWARYRLEADGPARTRVHFTQEVRVRDRRMRWASWLARPLLVWNHDRMMAGARDGLRRALADTTGIDTASETSQPENDSRPTSGFAQVDEPVIVRTDPGSGL